MWRLPFRFCGLAGPRLRREVWLAVPAGVGFGDVEAEGFEFGGELAEPAVVVEPGAVVGELLLGQDAGGGLAVFLAGPLVVGAVQAGRVGDTSSLSQPGSPASRMSLSISAVCRMLMLPSISGGGGRRRCRRRRRRSPGR